MKRPRHHRALATAALLAIGTLVLSQCSEDATEPIAIGSLSKVSGDNQSGLKGSQLPDPLVVVVKTVYSEPAVGVSLNFQVTAGGGTISRTSATSDGGGHASTELTLGPNVGENRVRVTVSTDPAQVVEFIANGGNYLCPEAEDIWREDYGMAGHVFLATSKSALFPGPEVGVVRVNPFNLGPNSPPDATFFTELPPQFGTIFPVVRDVAFSARGDFYVARNLLFEEVVKVATDGSSTRYARLDGISEIATNPSGLLIGCDETGPFFIGCRDSLLRWPEATFAGGVNNDALAVDPRRQSVDPLGEDIYFIYEPDRTLRRLALDSLSVEPGRGLETVASLGEAEALRARGMACDLNGNVYILVDADTLEADSTKALVRFAPDGTRAVMFDFYTRVKSGRPLADAGVQRDLAFARAAQYLYTLDTLNDNLLIYHVPFGPGGSILEAFDPDSTKYDAARANLSTSNAVGERVGLGALRDP